MLTKTTSVGIDVARDRLDVYIGSTGEELPFPNSRQGIKMLVKVVKSHNPSLVVMESTAGYEQAAAYAMTDADIPVSIVNAARVREYIHAKGIKAKTDRIDAKMLAEFGAVMLPRITILPNPEERELRRLVRRRAQVVKMKTQEQNHLCWASEKIRPYVEETLAALKQQLAQIEVEIAQALQTNPLWKERSELLCSVPGIATVTAATIIALLPEIGQINHRQIAALVGVAPFNRDSGASENKRHIEGGRKDVRRALYMATVVAIRHNPVIRSFHHRLIAAGKAQKVAITACIRKLVVIINAMMREGEHWQPVVRKAE